MRLARIRPVAVHGALTGERLDVGLALTVDRASAGDGDVLAALGIDEAALVEAGRVFGAPECGLDFGIVGRVGRAEKHGVALDVQLDAALHGDEAAQIAPFRQRHAAAAASGAVVDGGLNRRRVHGRAVAHSAVGANVAVQHEKASSNKTIFDDIVAQLKMNVNATKAL